MSNAPPGLDQVDPLIKDQVWQIVKTCKVLPEQAFQSLLLNDFSVEASIAALEAVIGNSKTTGILNRGFIEGTDYQDSDEQYQPYYYFDFGDKKYFYEKYPINVEFIKSRTQIEASQRRVNKNLQQIVGEGLAPSNLVSTLEEALCVSYNDKIPIFLLSYICSAEERSILKELFSLPDFRHKLDTQFLFFCMDPSYELEEWLVPLLELKQNSIMILRTNLFDSIEVVSKIDLTNGKEIMDEIKKAKTLTMKRYLDQKYMKLKHKMTKEGKYWRRPMSLKQREQQQKRLKSERKLMKQQEKDFKEMVQQLNEQKIVQNQKELQEESSKAEYKQKIQRKRAGLKIYEEGLKFKVRVPSGSSLFIIVPKEEKIQYLFDTIECKQESLGFQTQVPRNFDLFIGLDCTDNLSDSKEQQIGDRFDEAAFLVVREKEGE